MLTNLSHSLGTLEQGSACRRGLYQNTQHSQENYIQSPGDIRTRSPIKRTPVNSRLRPLGLWGRRRENLIKQLGCLVTYIILTCFHPVRRPVVDVLSWLRNVLEEFYRGCPNESRSSSYNVIILQTTFCTPQWLHLPSSHLQISSKFFGTEIHYITKLPCLDVIAYLMSHNN